MTCHCQPWAVNPVVLSLLKDPNLPCVCVEVPQGVDCHGGTWSTPADSHHPDTWVKTMVSHLSIPPHLRCHPSSAPVTRKDNFQGGELSGVFSKVLYARYPPPVLSIIISRKGQLSLFPVVHIFSEHKLSYVTEKNIPDLTKFRDRI